MDRQNPDYRSRNHSRSDDYDDYDDYDDGSIDLNSYQYTVGSRRRSKNPSGSRSDNSAHRSNSRSGNRTNTNTNTNHAPRPARQTSSNRTRSPYAAEEEEEENLSVFMYVTITIVTLAIISLAVALTISGGKKSKKDRTTDPNETSSVIVSDDRMIIDFDDTETDDLSSSPVSSKVTYASFLGKWQKTEVYEDRKATLTITMQYDDSFEFILKMWASNKTAAISGTAFYSDQNTAVYTPKKSVSLTFQKGTQYISVYHTGNNASFGIGDSFEIDGKYTSGDPQYIKQNTTEGYDYYIYQSDAVVSALSSTLSTEDYALYSQMMSKGLKSPIAYERTLDKNGKKVNVDAELNAVKYYAHLSSIGSDMILICSNDAKIYVLFYDTNQMRYYTNDPEYETSMPASFQAVANANHLQPLYR